MTVADWALVISLSLGRIVALTALLTLCLG